MPSPEQRSAINPETYLDDVLLWRPPLPVDQFDISDIEPLGPDMAQDVPGYAWERLPRWITQIEDTFKKSGDVPIVCVDLCSSIPLNAQMLRALEFKRSGERGREILKTLFSGDPEYHLEDPDMQSIHMAAARDEKVRRLLNSAIQAVLYTRNSEDMADGDYEPALRHLVGRFTEVLPQKTTSYVMEDGSRNLETRWGICFQSVDEGYTYLDVLANLEHPTSKAVQAGKRVRDASQEYYSDLQGITRKES